MTGPCKGGSYCYPLFSGGYSTKPGQIIAGQPQAPIVVGVGNITGFVCNTAPVGKPGEKFWSGACPGTWGPNGPFYDNGGGGASTISTGECLPPNPPPPPPVGFRRVYYKVTVPGNGPRDASGNTPSTFAWKPSYVPDNSPYQTPAECPCGKATGSPSTAGPTTLPGKITGPVTGSPPKSPAEGCGPVMPDGGEASRYLFGHDAGQHFSKGAVTGQFLSIPKHDGATASSQPNWTQKPRVIKNGDGIYQLWDGTADGDVWLAPGELYDYHLYGDGTLAGGKWPSRISEAGLKVLSAARSNSDHGDNAAGSIGLGKPTRNAGLASGWEAKLDFTDSATEPHIDWISKDASGASPAPGAEFRVNGNGVVAGPEVATDNAFARYDGTTGKLVQDSELTLSDLSASAVTISTVTAATAITLQAKKATGNNNGGSLTIRAGNAETSLGTGNGGALALDGGSEGGAGGTEGAISIGTTYAGSVAIAKTGVTTTINGPTVGKSSIKSDHATAGIGYATGAGGTVTQATSKSTGVTLNKACGQITTHAESLGDYSSTAFTVTNSAVAVGDTVVLSLAETGVEETGFSARSYVLSVENVVAGAFDIVIWNFSGGALAEALVIDFAVVKAVTG